MLLPLYSPQNLLLKQCSPSQSLATLFFQLLRRKAMKSSLPPLHSNASVNSVDFIFRIHSEPDYFLPSLLLLLWPKLLLSPIWLFAVASNLLFFHSPFKPIMLLLHHPKGKSQRSDIIFYYFPSSSFPSSHVAIKCSAPGPLHYCFLCLECSSSRWSYGLFPYFLQFSSQIQFHHISPPYKIAIASHFLLLLTAGPTQKWKQALMLDI